MADDGPSLVFALGLLGAGGFAIWYGFADPEGGFAGGLRELIANGGQGVTKRASATSAAYISSAVATLSSGGTGTASPTVASTGGAGAASGTRGAVIAEANTWLGVPYLWGGNTRSGVDCSGFTKAVFATAGVDLPRVSQAQALTGRAVSNAAAQPGDLVAFGLPVHHVGIYLGGNTIIHAPHGGTVVRVESIWRYEPVYFRNVLDGASPAAASTTGATIKAAAAKARPKRRTKTTRKTKTRTVST